MPAGAERDNPILPPLSARVELGALIGWAPHPALILDREGVIVDANARAEALFDQAAEGLRGRKLRAFLEEDDDLEGRLAQSARPGDAPSDILVHVAGAGGVDATFLPVHDEAGLVVVLLRDRNETRRSQDEQAAANKAEAAANKADAAANSAERTENRKMYDLGRLVAGVTHEMRTPLTYVANHLMIQRARLEDLMKRAPALSDDLREALASNEIAQQGVGRVVHIVQDLRPLSKNKPHRPVPMDLAELALDAVRTFRSTDGGRTQILLDLQSTHAVHVDRDDMANVLINLLNNAADAIGRKGAVRLQTRNVDVPPEIRVIDNGPGIHGDAARHLFEPFRTTKPDGTGLGLFISRRTVEAHGGTLTHEPTPGGGATFVVRLPSG